MWYNFKSADQSKKVGVLSGGERNRLLLAKTLTSGGAIHLSTSHLNLPRPCPLNYRTFRTKGADIDLESEGVLRL